MFITGPDVIKTVTGEEVGFEELGGAMSHNTKSGVAQFASDDEDACLEDCRYLLSFLPQNNLQTTPRVQPTDDPLRMDPELDHVVPDNPNKPYDMRDVVRPDRRRRGVLRGARALRAGTSSAASRAWTATRSASSATSRAQLAGVLDIDASAKAARFVRTCDAFNIPLLTFVRRARLPARHRPGVGRDHPPRGEAAVRVRRGDGAEADGDHAQGVRRRLRRDVLQAPARRLQLRLADRPRSR